ncbi:MAG: hypothetical protein RR416_04690 [Clostridia bacterium]
MKRKSLTTVAVCALFVAILMFCGCQPKLTNLEKVNELVSSKQSKLCVGGNTNFQINLTQMTEEEVFIADGKVGKQVSRTKLSLTPLNASYLKNEYKFVLIGENGQIEGAFVKDKLGVNFCKELEGLENIGKIKEIDITYGVRTDKLVMSDILENAIAFDKALNIAYTCFQTKIDSALGEKKFNREVYAKLVCNDAGAQNEYYWYVSFIADKDDYWSVLLNLTNGDILNQKISKL